MSYQSFLHSFPAAPIGGGGSHIEGSQQTGRSLQSHDMSPPPRSNLYGNGLITYPRPVHGSLTDSAVYRTAAYAAAAAAQGYGHLTTVDYPSLNTDGHENWRSQSATWPYDFNIGVYPYNTSYGGLDVRRKNATRESTSTLKAWLHEHIKNPYPTKGEKIMLAIITKMTLTQVSTWFANARRRLKKENKMQWSPNKRTDVDRDDDDDNDNDDVDDDDDDDDHQTTRLNVVADDESHERMDKIKRENHLQEAHSRDEIFVYLQQTSSHHQPTCVEPDMTSHRLFHHRPLLIKQPIISVSSSGDPTKKTEPFLTKPRIWSLAEVATTEISRPCPTAGANNIGNSNNDSRINQPTKADATSDSFTSGILNSSSSAEVSALHRPKFQPWAEDVRSTNWSGTAAAAAAAAAASNRRLSAVDDDLVFKTLSSPSDAAAAAAAAAASNGIKWSAVFRQWPRGQLSSFNPTTVGLRHQLDRYRQFHVDAMTRGSGCRPISPAGDDNVMKSGDALMMMVRPPIIDGNGSYSSVVSSSAADDVDGDSIEEENYNSCSNEEDALPSSSTQIISNADRMNAVIQESASAAGNNSSSSSR